MSDEHTGKKPNLVAIEGGNKSKISPPRPPAEPSGGITYEQALRRAIALQTFIDKKRAEQPLRIITGGSCPCGCGRTTAADNPET
jgi:hypothetical protein